MTTVAITAAEWPALIRRMRLPGLLHLYGESAELVSCDVYPTAIDVRLRVPLPAMARHTMVEPLKVALAERLGKFVRLSVEVHRRAA